MSSPRTKSNFLFAILATIKSNGFWAPWAPWTACVLTDANDCSTGKQTRNRVCIGPEAGGEACVGSLTEESRFCGLEHCVSCKYQFRPIVFAFLMQISLSTYLLLSTWFELRFLMNFLFFTVYPHKDIWTQWSSCSEVCGNSGTRKRVRYCYKATEMCASDEESESCPGTTCPSETTDTNTGEWSEWTSCQLSLDGKSAFQVRNRECSTTDCSDALQESQSCTHVGLSLGNF